MTEKEFHGIFSRNIKQYRKGRRWSQVQLAKEAKISLNFINDLEAGKKWASPATLIKLADVFHIEAYELLKPPGLPPGSMGSLILDYTEAVQAAVEQTCRDFLHTGDAASGKDTGK